MNPLTSTAPRIFVLEPDDQARPVLKHNLQTWGYQVTVSIDAADALQRTQGGRERFELILIDQMEQTLDECRAIGQQIRQNTAQDSRAPLIILAECYGVDLEG